MIGVDDNTIRFFAENPSEERSILIQGIIRRHPDRIPVIVGSCSPGFTLKKCKFMTYQHVKFSEFMFHISKNSSLNSCEQALFYMVNDKHLISCSQTMGEIYQQHKTSCGCLYIVCRAESTFG